MKSKFILLFLFCFPTYATSLSLGTSVNYLNINDPNFIKRNDLELGKLNIGLNHRIDNWLISTNTNRLLLKPSSEIVISKKNGVSFGNKTKITADTLAVSYFVKPQISLGLFATNTQVNKSLYHNNTLLTKTKQSALLYGLIGNYYYDKNLSFSTAIIAPNQELNLESGIVFGINYNFNL